MKRIVSILTALAMLCAAAVFYMPAAHAEDSYVDLTTLTPTSAQVGWGELHINSGLDGKAIDMQNNEGGTTVYAHGFTAHASSILTFDISGYSTARAFTAYIGAEHATSNGYPSATSIKFIVLADGVKLFESEEMGYYTPAVEIFVMLPAGTRVLTLKTDDCGSNTGDHSAWGEPRLFVGDVDPASVKTVTLTSPHTAYPAGASVQLDARFTAYTGEEVHPENVVYTSSDESVATVSPEGLVTSVGAGSVTVSATVANGAESATGKIGLVFLDKETDEQKSYGGFYDLSKVTPTRAVVGWGELHVNTGLDGKELDMANGRGGTTVFGHGFTAHASSSLDFDIETLTEAQMFTAYIGAEHSSNNSTSSSTSISFLVYADGVKLYESGVFGYNDEAEEIFVIIPQGTKTLTLKTDDCGGNNGDHSAWGNPRILTDPGVFDTFKEIVLSTDKRVYTTGSEVQIEAAFYNLGNEEFTPESVTYTSSRPEVASVDENGKIVSHAEGTARFTVSATYKGVTLEKTITVTFMDEIVEQDFTLTSPEGKVRFDLHLDDQGRLSYTVTGDGSVSVLERSYIGFETEQCDFSDALAFAFAERIKNVDETYTVPSGKASKVRNYYNEQTLAFKKDVYFFDVTIRLYDDGFAYRFTVRRADEGAETLNVISETSTFKAPEKSKIYAEFISTLTSSFCYESGYSAADTGSVPNPYICMPATFDLYAGGASTGKYLLLSEADCFSDIYPGSLFVYDMTKKDGSMGIGRAPKVISGDTVTVEAGFTSPWRFGIYGDLATLFESDMAEKLAPAPEGDYSWVEPGVTAWMWLSEGYSGQRTESTIREYIDMASEMGWKYLILDEGWQPNSSKPGKVYDGYFSYFEDLIAYAESKGVGFIAWVKYYDLDTPEERAILDEWADMGIKGIKADFFDSEDPATLAGYKAIYEKCAENRLIVNCHGASKPTGERRTYPNVINREAVNGEEYGGFWLNAAMYWAFARNVVGPIDITPRLYATGGATTVAQMAVNVIFESGIPCMASDSSDYLNFNANSFYKDLPAAWDETKLLDGQIGSIVSVARRSGDNWYASTMSLNAKSGLTMDLSFLGEGSYTAYIYSETSRSAVKVETKTVTKDDVLTYSVMQKGAYIVKFVKNTDDPFDVNRDGKVDIEDVTALLGMLSGAAATSSPCDLNGDGATTVEDVTRLLNYLKTYTA